MLENIILIRNIFYKIFLIAFLFYIFSVVFFQLYNVWAINYVGTMFNITSNESSFLIAYFLGWMKTISLMFFLVPALALHWTGHNIKIANNK